MENLKKMLDEMKVLQNVKSLTAEQRAVELAEIESNIKQLSEILHVLFNRKHELETAEEEYQKEQERLNEEYLKLQEFFSPKK